MNKKMIVGGFLAVFILLTISYATAVSSNTTNVEYKNSPLFQIRARQAISEKIGGIINNIKTKFLGERIFFLKFQLIKRSPDPDPACITFFLLCKIPCTQGCYPTVETICP